MKIKHDWATPFEVDLKRFYVPGCKLDGHCPKCNQPFTLDFGEQYISFPVANAVNEVACWCCHCENEWNVNVRLNFSLELVP
jgi:hypothetical protein